MLKYILTLALAITLVLPKGHKGEIASFAEWSNPINLSNSGAASQPRIIVGPEGAPAVFWWDQFDGLMISYAAADGSWSEPVPSPIRTAQEGSPRLLTDSAGTIYALWIESQPTGQSLGSVKSPLVYSQMPFGASSWTFPKIIAESAVDFDVNLSPSGEIILGYIRALNTKQAAAGVYVTKKAGARVPWSPPALVKKSVYMRLLTSDQAHIKVASAGTPTTTMVYYLSWFDPFTEGEMWTFTLDGGKIWQEPELLESASSELTAPRLFPGEQVSFLWESELPSGCTLYRQAMQLEATADSNPVMQPDLPEPFLEEISECPYGDEQFETIDGKLFWIWGQGTARITLTAQDVEQEKWTLPNKISVSFEDPVTDETTYLEDLHAVFSGNRLTVVGTDVTRKEVWVAQSEASATEMAYESPSPWSDIQTLVFDGETADAPAMVIDGQGRTHMAWSSGQGLAKPGDSIHYAKNSVDGVLGPVEIVSPVKGVIARQPALVYEDQREILHLVWSGGADGSLFYMWVSADEAGAVSAWSAPVALPSLPDSSWPQIAKDQSGVLYVLFAVPLNEARGIYLIRSTDGGANWSNPKYVFNAGLNEIPMAAYPTFTIGPDGALYAAWVNSRTPGVGGSLEIDFSTSSDSGETWSVPLVLASEGFSWPHLALAGDQLHLMYAFDSSNNTIYQRYADTLLDVTEISAWGPPDAVPGWKDVILPYSLVTSGEGVSEGRLYLLGADPLLGILHYASWEGERWTRVEHHQEISILKNSLGIGAVANPLDGQLTVGWLAYANIDESEDPSLFLISRDIPVLPASTAMPPASTATAPAATPTPVASPQPTIIPSPTPNLNQAEQGSSLPFQMPPMAFGGILVAFLVVVIFAGRFLISQVNPHSH